MDTYKLNKLSKISLPTIYPDGDLYNADWTKKSWDLPPYKSEDFMLFLKSSNQTLEEFRNLPVYRHAVRNELIKNDEWVEKK